MDQLHPQHGPEPDPNTQPSRRTTFVAPAPKAMQKKPTPAGRIFGAGGKHRGRLSKRNTLAAFGIAAACTLGVTGTGMIATLPVAESAFAATHAYGYDLGDGWLGSFGYNGVELYCLQITQSPPLGATSSAGNVKYASMSKDENAKVNFAVTNYGQRKDNNWAAATHLYVWSLADTAEYNSHGMSGDDYYVARAPQDQRADILAKLAYIRGQAAGITAASTVATGGSVSMKVDTTNNYVGTATIVLPAGFTGTAKLENGVFIDSGKSSLAGIGAGETTLDVRGVPGELVDYKIKISVTADGPGGYAGQIGLYKTPGQQDTAGPGPKGTSHLELNAEDPSPRSTVFQPAVGTKVSSVYVEKGDQLCDIKEFAAAADENGRVNEWPVNPANGKQAPVTGRTSVWGPSLHEFEESATPPKNTTLHQDGMTYTGSPDKTVEVCADKRATQSGYYTWWDEIDAADQIDAVQKRIPADYLFQAVFGQVAETSIVPMDLDFESTIQAKQLMIGDTTTDAFTSEVRNGGWMTENGTQIDVKYTHTVRWSETDPSLELGPDAPNHAEVLATFTTTRNDVGEFEVPNIPAGYKAGFVNVQTCVEDAAGKGRIGKECDLYGLPSETVQVYEPIYSTSAQTDQTGITVRDLFDVRPPFEGAKLPEGGIDIQTQGYYIPKDGEHVCTADTILDGIGTTAPIRVTEWGQYETEWQELPEDKRDGGVQYVEHGSYTPDGTDTPVWEKPGDCTNTIEYTPVVVPEEPTPVVEPTEPAKPATPAKPAPAAAAPTDLAETGANLAPYAITAGALLAAGTIAGVYVITRRRHNKEESPTT